MSFSTGDIVHATGKYEWYTILSHTKEAGVNYYTLITPHGTTTGRFREDALTKAEVGEQDATYVAIAFELCRDFLQQGHHKPFIEEQILNSEDDRASFERAFATALSIHLTKSYSHA